MVNPVERLQRDILETQASLKLIQEQIANKKPWYREVPGLISVIAFLISTGSTFYSCQRESIQDRSDAQMTMNSLSQRLITLPKENLEAGIKYKDDHQTLKQVLSLANMENATNMDSLEDLIRRYPAVATDHHKYVLALALRSSGQPIRSNIILAELARNAKSPNVLIAANRDLAGMELFNRESDKGRYHYRRSIAIVDQNPQMDAFVKNSYNQETYLHWASSEYHSGNCSAAKEALERAKALKVPGNPHAKSFLFIDQTIQDCPLSNQPTPSKPPPLVLPQDALLRQDIKIVPPIPAD